MPRFRDHSPAQKFRRFEQVRLQGFEQARSPLNDSIGTVFWADPPQKTNQMTDQWIYCVHLDAHHRYLNVLESNLRSTGEFSSEDEYLGTAFELGHDLLPDEDGNFSFVEGTYRLPGKLWQVMIFSEWDVPTLRHRMTTWDSGITGVVFYVPLETRLNKAFVERAMSEVFGAEQWIEVRGPDSITLR